jgi:hypothetical protein
MYRPLAVPSPAPISIPGTFGVTDCNGRSVSEAYWQIGASILEQAEKSDLSRVQAPMTCASSLRTKKTHDKHQRPCKEVHEKQQCIPPNGKRT